MVDSTQLCGHPNFVLCWSWVVTINRNHHVDNPNVLCCFILFVWKITICIKNMFLYCNTLVYGSEIHNKTQLTAIRISGEIISSGLLRTLNLLYIILAEQVLCVTCVILLSMYTMYL